MTTGRTNDVRGGVRNAILGVARPLRHVQIADRILRFHPLFLGTHRTQNFSRQSCCDDSGPEFDEDGLKAKQQALAKWVPTN